MRRLVLAASIAALVPSPARALISREAEPVLQRYRKAIGVTDSTPPERTAHGKGTLRAIKLQGTYEFWYEHPDRFASVERLGSLAMRSGYDGERAWRTDPSSRKVVMVDGKELEQIQAEGYFRSEAWMLPDQGGGKVSFAGKVFNADGAFLILQVTPPAGSPRRFWFSQKTGLLARIEGKFDNEHAVEHLSEYRMIGGRKRPTAVEGPPTDGPDDRTRATLDSLWVDVPLPADVFAPPEAPGTRVAWLKTRGMARIPFRYGSKHIWVKVSINGGPPADFLLDTGAATTVVDSAFAVRCGVKTEGGLYAQGVAGLGTMTIGTVRSLKLAGREGDGVRLRDLKVGVLEFEDEFEWSMWRKPYGLVGFDVISRFVTEVDFDQGVVTFHDPRTFTYSGKGTAVPMRLAGNVPAIAMKVNGACEGEYRVDVGSSATVHVGGSLVRRCQLMSKSRERREVYFGGIGGARLATAVRLDKMEIGPFSWSEPIAIFSLHRTGVLGSEQYAGLIGNGILERFICTFDYERRRLYLEPGARYARRDQHPVLGAWLVRIRDRVVVGKVDRGTPAHQAGLLLEDEVVVIDGKPALQWSREDLDRMFVDGTAGQKHSLTIRRDGREKKVELDLDGEGES